MDGLEGQVPLKWMMIRGTTIFENLYFTLQYAIDGWL